jgi:hypothetical protein
LLDKPCTTNSGEESRQKKTRRIGYRSHPWSQQTDSVNTLASLTCETRTNSGEDSTGILSTIGQITSANMVNLLKLQEPTEKSLVAV